MLCESKHRVMKKRGWILFMALFTWIITYSNEPIPFNKINGLIIVEASVDGVLGNYILDSGANGLILNRSCVASSEEYLGLDGDINGEEIVVNSFEFGKFSEKDLSAFCTDLTNLEQYTNYSINGIFGQGIIDSRYLIIDFTNNTLVFDDNYNDEDSEEYVIDFKLVNDLPIVSILVSDKKLNFILDSGASTNFIDANLLDEIAFDPTGIYKEIFTASGTTSNVELVNLKNVQSGDLSLPNIEALPKDFTTFSETMDYPVHGLLSMNTLSTNQLVIDQKKRSLIIK